MSTPNWTRTPQVMRAKVMHKRHAPKQHQFKYDVYYLALPMQQLEASARGIFSIDRWNLMSFYHRDHGARDGSDCRAWAQELLQRFKLADAVTHVVLISLPRIAGYVFNPVSFWLGFNDQGQIMAAIAEVNNTFGETHSYVLANSDGAAIGADQWLQTSKDFHVSPFLAVEGTYQFRFATGTNTLGVWIDHYNPEGKILLNTAVTGRMQPMTQGALWRAFLSLPLVTVKVVTLIHYEAIRLMLKKIRYRNKPPQQAHRVTPWS